MIKSGQEWVSAAADGEVDTQTIAELAADKASHGKWKNYHMIGDAMRGELPKTFDLDLSASIAAAIELEPAILAPQTSQIKAQQTETPNQAIKPANNVSNLVPLFKQLGQYAIAASVALVAVVGVQNYNQQQDAQAPMSVLTTRPLVGSVSPVSLQTGGQQSNAQGVSNEQMVEQRRRINAYIQDHMLQQRLNPGVISADNSQQESSQ
ncbi:sigma-E factor negative regulatory protein [Shewanella sp. SR44-3]|uniref:sigma-E factor negative regulatory protein n=1 Tax=unclassified Shewanella TaxID=196818 RepID=UPI0015FB6CF6|nr:RseA family anti-sigma factor [Shewanella sp. SR44-3]MBB1269835.1 anti-sigma factor [Shewanella sp. SR44-3]